MTAQWFSAFCYLVLLEAFMCVEYRAAYRDGYARKEQVLMLPNVPTKYLTFEGHGGMWGDMIVMPPIVAYLLATHAASWPLLGFAAIFLVSALSGAWLALPLMDDSKKVPSALMRDGYFPLAGAMHYLFYAVALAICAAYYLLTPQAALSATEMVIVSVLIMAHWAAGVLQPPLAVHGRIHWVAWTATGSVWLAIIILVVVRLTLI
jgi:hypothetical protein